MQGGRYVGTSESQLGVLNFALAGGSSLNLHLAKVSLSLSLSHTHTHARARLYGFFSFISVWVFSFISVGLLGRFACLNAYH